MFNTLMSNSIKRNASVDHSVQLTKNLEEGDDKVINTETMQFLASLHRRFEKKRQQILDARKSRQLILDAGQLPNFLTTTEDIRRSNWKIRGKYCKSSIVIKYSGFKTNVRNSGGSSRSSSRDHWPV